jgi:hypothetical protein
VEGRPSEFEARVFEVLVRGDAEEDVLRNQLSLAVVTAREYTGVGLYVDLRVPRDAMRLSTSNRYIEQVPKAHLEHPMLPAGAGALLWLEDGYIATLECYTYDGSWPTDESAFVVHENTFDV